MSNIKKYKKLIGTDFIGNDLSTEMFENSKAVSKILNKLEKEMNKNKQAIEMFNDETLNKYYYGMSYEFEIDDFREDILKILKGEE